QNMCASYKNNGGLTKSITCLWLFQRRSLRWTYNDALVFMDRTRLHVFTLHVTWKITRFVVKFKQCRKKTFQSMNATRFLAAVLHKIRKYLHSRFCLHICFQVHKFTSIDNILSVLDAL